MILSETAFRKCLNSSHLRSKQVQEPMRYAPSTDAVSTENLKGASLTSNQSGVLFQKRVRTWDSLSHPTSSSQKNQTPKLNSVHKIIDL